MTMQDEDWVRPGESPRAWSFRPEDHDVVRMPAQMLRDVLAEAGYQRQSEGPVVLSSMDTSGVSSGHVGSADVIRQHLVAELEDLRSVEGKSLGRSVSIAQAEADVDEARERVDEAERYVGEKRQREADLVAAIERLS